MNRKRHLVVLLAVTALGGAGIAATGVWREFSPSGIASSIKDMVAYYGDNPVALCVPAGVLAAGLAFGWLYFRQSAAGRERPLLIVWGMGNALGSLLAAWLIAVGVWLSLLASRAAREGMPELEGILVSDVWRMAIGALLFSAAIGMNWHMFLRRLKRFRSR